MTSVTDRAADAMRHIAVDGLMHRLSPGVREVVRQDLIQKVGNALRMHQRQAQADLHAIAAMLRHQAQTKELDEFIQQEISAEWGAW